MEDLKLNHQFKEETIFSNQLTQNLRGQKIFPENNPDSSTIINAEHNLNQGSRRIPDITLRPRDTVEMEYRELSSPFYIECKLGREYRKSGNGYTSLLQIKDNLMQILSYKYQEDTENLKNLEKYGDNHVAVTTPYLLKDQPPVNDFSEDYINLAQLMRTLWKLGIGLFYQAKSGQYVIAFNEDEVIYFE